MMSQQVVVWLPFFGHADKSVSISAAEVLATALDYPDEFPDRRLQVATTRQDALNARRETVVTHELAVR
jgi:hypothetical protein